MSSASPSSRSTSSRLRWGRNRGYSSCLQMVAMSATGGTGERAVRRSSRMEECPTLRRSMTMPSRSPSRSHSPSPVWLMQARSSRATACPRIGARLPLASTARKPDDSKGLLALTIRRPPGTLLLELDLHAVDAQLELHAAGHGVQVDHHAVRILHRARAGASGHRRACGRRGVLTLEVLELLQMVDVAGRVDAGHADVGHRQAIDTERVLLPLVVERSFAPGDADPRRD